jgi:hypothetical protein
MNRTTADNVASIKQQILSLENQQHRIEAVSNKTYNTPHFGELLKLLGNHPNIILRFNGQDVELITK